MPCYVGLDASKKSTSVCVLDARGQVLREGAVESTPSAIKGFLRGEGRRYALVGIEAWSLASWLYEGLAHAGLPVVCIEATHAHVVLKAQPNKTDRADARGIAELMRIGSYRAVHVKTQESQRIRSMLTARRFLKSKLVSLQSTIRGFLLGAGGKLDSGRVRTFGGRAQQLARKDPFLRQLIEPLLEVWALLVAKIHEFDDRLAEIAKADAVCQLLQTAPGIGPIAALTYRAAIDVPTRFARSRDVGPHLGLVPRTYQSGDSERRGRISRRGNSEARAALYMSAVAMLRSNVRRSWLKDWAQEIAKRRGGKKAVVALARRLAVVLHKMWITNTPFRWEAAS
jgi:transposase